MSPGVIHALVLRHLYLYRRNPIRLVELLFWPVMEMMVWGNLSVWLEKSKGGTQIPTFIPYLIGGVILWDVLFRAQQAVAISFLEDVWTKNLVNILVAPVRPLEYVISGCIVGLLRIGVTVIVLSILAAAAFHFNVLQFQWNLVPFFGLLMLFGWTLGMISSSLILRWGQAAESLAWAVPFLIQPVAAVYYPIGGLPSWAQSLGWLLPCTPVFEGMRGVLSHGGTNFHLLGLSVISNLIWMVFGAGIYLYVLATGRRNGTLTRVTSH
ncbi:MAG: ABC transporter permease [Verrucomicrobiaceae bacterium]|nr:MAG: ABC transporter permease [Verrucomicrobiaceae bacterium]